MAKKPRNVLKLKTRQQLANSLHQQGKFEEALGFYLTAISRWENVTQVSGERRARGLQRLKEEMQYCERDAAPGR